MSYFVYILYSEKLDRYYIGTTDGIEKRLAEHNSAHYANAFTSKGIPWKLFLLIDNLASNQAYKMEIHIKEMKSKKYIINLSKYPEMIEKLKQKYA